MLAIDGMAAAGLGPPRATRGGVHGNGSTVDFATVLETAGRGAHSWRATETVTPRSDSSPVEAASWSLGERQAVDDESARGTHIEVMAGLTGELTDGVLTEATAGTSGSTGPDRTSEAVIETDSTDSTDEALLLAARMVVQSGLTTPLAPPPPPAAVLVVGDPSTERSPIAGAVRPLGVAGDAVETTEVDRTASESAGIPKGPDGVLASIEPGERGEVASAARRPDHAGKPEQAERGGQPEERLGAVIRELPVEERSAAARAWNRAGGRFHVDAPPPDPATPVEPAVGDTATPVIDASGAATDLGGGNAEGSGASSTGDGAPAPTGAPDLDAPPADGTADSDSNAAGTLAEAYRAGRAVVGQPEVQGTPRDAAASATTLVDTGDPAVMHARLTETIHRAAGSGDESIRLVLSPPELGHLNIRVERTDGGLRVDVTAATAEATDLIQRALPALVSGLEARALRVDSAEVRHASTSGDPSNSRGGEAGARQSGERGTDDGRQWARPDWSEAARLGQPAARTGDRGRVATGLLDLVA